MKGFGFFWIIFLLASTIFASNDMPDFKNIIRNRRESETQRWEQITELNREQNRPTEVYDTRGMTIEIALDFENETFEAVCTLDIESLVDSLESFSFDYDHSYAIHSIEQNGVNLWSTTWPDVIIATLNEPAQAGETFTIEVEYHSFLDDRLSDGLKFEYHAGTPVAFTMCSPFGARKWIPCNDTPADKIDTVDLFITYPSEYLSAANGLLQETIDNGDGTKTDHWHESHPITSYLISFAVTNYQVSSFNFVWEGQTMPVDNYVYPEHFDSAVELFNQCGEMLTFYSSIYGEYPFLDEKYGHAVCTDLGAQAMEHQTCTSFRAGYMSDEAAPYTVAHELSHQWGGDCLSIEGWYDVWLKEGFATYSEALWAEHLYGTEGLLQYMEDLDSGSDLDPTLYRDPFGSSNDIFDWTIYAKGAWTMHMLRGVIGDEAFFDSLYGILNDPDFRYGNYNTNQFRDYAEEVSGMELDWFFECWYLNEGRPRYEYAVMTSLSWFPELQFPLFIIRSEGTSGDEFTMQVPFDYGSVSGSYLVEPGFNYYQTHLPDFGWDIEWDPDGYVLDGGFTEKLPVLGEVPRRDGKVGLVWEPYFDQNIDGYLIYRSENDSAFVRITDDPVQGTSYLDEDLNPESQYAYKIQAAHMPWVSRYSNTIVTQPVDYSFDTGILVVDNSMNYNTGALPTDEEMDAFYDDILLHYPHHDWDVSEQGMPPLSEMGKYSTIIWHADDIQQLPLVDDMYRLRNYVLAGGNLLISQCKKTSTVQPATLDDFFGIESVNFSNSPDFAGAIDSGAFMDIPIDPDRLPLPNWTDGLGFVSRYSVDTDKADVIYTYDSVSDDPEWENEPCGIRLRDFDLVLLGFPLYFMMADEARAFMDYLMDDFGELQPAVDEQSAPVCGVEVSLYPNPFNPDLNIRLMLDRPGRTEIRIYNVRGEMVRSFEPEMLDAGIHNRTWDGTNSRGTPVSSGIYFVRTSHAGKINVSRAALIK